VSSQLHVPAAPPPGKSPLYPLERRLGLPQNLSWRLVEVRNLAPYWDSKSDPLGLPAHSPQPVSISTALSRLFLNYINELQFLNLLVMPSLKLQPLHIVVTTRKAAVFRGITSWWLFWRADTFDVRMITKFSVRFTPMRRCLCVNSPLHKQTLGPDFTYTGIATKCLASRYEQ
jgi:hypothetical protein